MAEDKTLRSSRVKEMLSNRIEHLRECESAGGIAATIHRVRRMEAESILSTVSIMEMSG